MPCVCALRRESRPRWRACFVLRRVDSGRTLSVACGDSCSPFCRLPATSSPGRGKSFHSGRALGRTGRSRPHRLLARRSLPLSCKLFALAKASTFGGGGISQSEMTEGVASGTNPLSLAALDSSPEGRALGKEGKFRPHRLLARRSLSLSCKLSALAKASPFRERWHGEAVTERVAPITSAWRDGPPGGSHRRTRSGSWWKAAHPCDNSQRTIFRTGPSAGCCPKTGADGWSRRISAQ